MGDIRIERMTPADWERVRRIRLRALADAPDAFAILLADEEREPPEHWQRRLASDGAATFLAVEESASGPGDPSRDVGLVVGAGYGGAPEDAGLYAMWVDPGMRGRGIGRALVAEVLAWARSRGRGRVILDVADANLAAVRLYESCGFEPTGVTGVVDETRPHVREHQRAVRVTTG